MYVMRKVQGDVIKYIVIVSNAICSIIGKPTVVPCSVITINLNVLLQLFKCKLLLAVLTSSQRSAVLLSPTRI